MREIWQLRILRHSIQIRGERVRTVGTYSVCLDGVTLPHLTGTSVECGGPGANAPEGNGRRLVEGEYEIAIHMGANYATVDYDDSPNFLTLPKPAVGLVGTGARTEILVHPGVGFLRSVGCINLTGDLEDAEADINLNDSIRRVVAVLKNLEVFLGRHLPSDNATRIPNASVVIAGEP
jgi:hypothetical protein